MLPKASTLSPFKLSQLANRSHQHFQYYLKNTLQLNLTTHQQQGHSNPGWTNHGHDLGGSGSNGNGGNGFNHFDPTNPNPQFFNSTTTQTITPTPDQFFTPSVHPVHGFTGSTIGSAKQTSFEGNGEGSGAKNGGTGKGAGREGGTGRGGKKWGEGGKEGAAESQSLITAPLLSSADGSQNLSNNNRSDDHEENEFDHRLTNGNDQQSSSQGELDYSNWLKERRQGRKNATPSISGRDSEVASRLENTAGERGGKKTIGSGKGKRRVSGLETTTSAAVGAPSTSRRTTTSRLRSASSSATTASSPISLDSDPYSSGDVSQNQLTSAALRTRYKYTFASWVAAQKEKEREIEVREMEQEREKEGDWRVRSKDMAKENEVHTTTTTKGKGKARAQTPVASEYEKDDVDSDRDDVSTILAPSRPSSRRAFLSSSSNGHQQQQHRRSPALNVWSPRSYSSPLGSPFSGSLVGVGVGSGWNNVGKKEDAFNPSVEATETGGSSIDGDAMVSSAIEFTRPLSPRPTSPVLSPSSIEPLPYISTSSTLRTEIADAIAEARERQGGLSISTRSELQSESEVESLDGGEEINSDVGLSEDGMRTPRARSPVLLPTMSFNTINAATNIPLPPSPLPTPGPSRVGTPSLVEKKTMTTRRKPRHGFSPAGLLFSSSNVNGSTVGVNKGMIVGPSNLGGSSLRWNSTIASHQFSSASIPPPPSPSAARKRNSDSSLIPDDFMVKGKGKAKQSEGISGGNDKFIPGATFTPAQNRLAKKSVLLRAASPLSEKNKKSSSSAGSKLQRKEKAPLSQKALALINSFEAAGHQGSDVLRQRVEQYLAKEESTDASSSSPKWSVEVHNQAMLSFLRLNNNSNPGKIHFEDVIGVWRHMREVAELEEDAVTWSLVIECLARKDAEVVERRLAQKEMTEEVETKTEEEEDHFAEALALYEALGPEIAGSLSLAAINSLLRSCVFRSDLELGLKIFDRLESDASSLSTGVQRKPDPVTYAYLIELFSRKGDYEGAENVLRAWIEARNKQHPSLEARESSAPSAQPEPDSSYGFEAGLMGEEGVALAPKVGSKLEFARYRPLSYRKDEQAPWDRAVVNACREGRVDKAMALVEEIMQALPSTGTQPKPGYPPRVSAHSLASVIEALINSGELNSAMTWFNRVARLTSTSHPVQSQLSSPQDQSFVISRPRFAFYHRIISALVRQGLTVPALEVYTKMADVSLKNSFQMRASHWKLFSNIVVDEVIEIARRGNQDPEKILEALFKAEMAFVNSIKQARVGSIPDEARTSARDVIQKLIDANLGQGLPNTALDVLVSTSTKVGKGTEGEFIYRPLVSILSVLDLLRSNFFEIPVSLHRLAVSAFVSTQSDKHTFSGLFSINDLQVLDEAVDAVASESLIETGQAQGLKDMVNQRREVLLAATGGNEEDVESVGTSVTQTTPPSTGLSDGTADTSYPQSVESSGYGYTYNYSPYSYGYGYDAADQATRSLSKVAEQGRYLSPGDPNRYPTPPATPPSVYASLSPDESSVSAEAPQPFDLDLTYRIENLSKKNNVNGAYDLLMSSVRDGVYPTISPVYYLLNRHAYFRDHRKLRELYVVGHSILQRMSHDPQEQSLWWVRLESAIMCGLAFLGRLEEVGIHRDILVQAGGAPHADAYAYMILEAKETTDDAAVAVALFEESQRLGVEPNVFLYNTLISRLARARRSGDALRYYEMMRQQGIEPTSVTYGCVISASCRVGDEDAAEYLFDEMRRASGYIPRVPPYNTMMQFYTDTKPNRDKVLHYFDLMLQASVPPTQHTYTLLLRAYGCLSPPDNQSMMDVFSRLCEEGYPNWVTAAHWSTIITSVACVQKDWDQAKEIFDGIKQHESTIKYATEMKRIQKSQKNGGKDRQQSHASKWKQEGEKTSSRATELSASTKVQLPDAVCYEALFNGMIACKRMDLIDEYLIKMKNDGVKMTAYAANVVIKAYASVGRIAEARKLFESMSDPPAGVAANGNHPSSSGVRGTAVGNTNDGKGAIPVKPLRRGDKDRVYREASTFETMIRAELSYSTSPESHARAEALLNLARKRAFPTNVFNRLRAPLTGGSETSVGNGSGAASLAMGGWNMGGGVE